jgi:hypothetical protein
MCILAAVGVVAGCALRDTRDDYERSQASAGLWGDRPFELIDWNFPTSRNQPPIEAPKRLRLERTAIGVTWATRNPLPLSDNLTPNDVPPAPADEGATRRQSGSRPDRGDAGDSARARERVATR